MSPPGASRWRGAGTLYCVDPSDGHYRGWFRIEGGWVVAEAAGDRTEHFNETGHRVWIKRDTVIPRERVREIDWHQDSPRPG